jgi:hypothetical protein
LIDALTGGAALLLTGALLVAGLVKALGLRTFAVAVHRLLPVHLPRRRGVATAFAAAVCVVEFALAVALVFPHQTATPVAGAALALTVGFVLVIRRAIRLGTACGCFASLSDGVAGVAELTRAAGLAVIAAGLLAGDLTGHAVTPWSAGSAAAAVVLAAGLYGAIWLAGHVSRAPASRPGWFAATMSGRIRTTARSVPAGFAEVHGSERRRVLSAISGAPSLAAFEQWLAGEELIVDLRRSLVTRLSQPGPQTSLLVTPPRVPRLYVRLSLLWDGRRVVDVAVAAVVDGRAVGVVGGVVRENVEKVTVAR